MHIWDTIDRALETKSRILVGTSSGKELEGILIGKDTDGNWQIQTEDKGIINLFWSKIGYFSIIDNLTHIERLAKERKLI